MRDVGWSAEYDAEGERGGEDKTSIIQLSLRMKAHELGEKSTLPQAMGLHRVSPSWGMSILRTAIRK